jgi:hypothetical protein
VKKRSRHPFFAAVLLGALAASCGETTDSYYSSLGAARSEGALARGWLPAFLPASAVAIHERHDGDWSATLLAFRFDPADPFLASAPCLAVSEAEIVPPPRLGRTPWWPRALLGARRGGFRLFRCRDARPPAPPREAWLAVDVARGECFFWRTSR